MVSAAVPDRGARMVTAHDAATYLPKPQREREGIALCLSGGGFRATLFHLGAVRRLNELGILSKVDTISSVSGGSILSAHLAEHLRPWPAPGAILPDDEWRRRVAEPVHAFTARNLRTLPLLKRLLPPNWLRPSTAVMAMQERYEVGVTRLRLPDLPERPRFIFCAADLAYGVNWVFERRRVGDYQVGYVRPAPDWPVAQAVAASSCFPPVFDPMPVPDDFKSGRIVDGNARRDEGYKKRLRTLSLSDAGIYDNLGLEPVWKTHQVVLVSDGGATFDPDWDKGLLWRLSRYIAVISNQSAAVRKRWLISNFVAHDVDVQDTNPYDLQGTYWSIGTPAERYTRQGGEPPPGYPERLVAGFISEVRTDLDAFSEPERVVLENHGYLLADAAIQRYLPDLIEPAARPLSIPHPDWMAEDKVADALRDSDTVKLLGRW